MKGRITQKLVHFHRAKNEIRQGMKQKTSDCNLLPFLLNSFKIFFFEIGNWIGVITYCMN